MPAGTALVFIHLSLFPIPNIHHYPATCRGNRQAMGILKGSQELPLSRRRANLLRTGEIQIGINTPPLGAEMFIYQYGS